MVSVWVCFRAFFALTKCRPGCSFHLAASRWLCASPILFLIVQERPGPRGLVLCPGTIGTWRAQQRCSVKEAPLADIPPVFLYLASAAWLCVGVLLL